LRQAYREITVHRWNDAPVPVVMITESDEQGIGNWDNWTRVEASDHEEITYYLKGEQDHIQFYFNASGSWDPDGDTVTDFRWEVEYGNDGCIQHESVMNTTVNLTEGDHVLSLAVGDGEKISESLKFLMYRDLDPDSWPEETSPTHHPLIRSILVPTKRKPVDRGFSESDVDRKLDPEKVYHVMDADSSQIAVIEDAKAGRNLVVEGPPGTGKSQTITNIIAELLASGRTVLFVSEKMAALEVVKERLDMVGLGEFCLELHSHKAKRTEVLRELERTLSTPPPKKITLDYEFIRLRKLIKDLNSYPEAMHSPIGELGLTPFRLIGMYEESHHHFTREDRTLPRIPMDDVLYCPEQQWKRTTTALHNLAEILSFIHPAEKNPWYGCKLPSSTPTDVEEIGNHVQQTLNALEGLRKNINTMIRLSRIHRPRNLHEIPQSQASATVIAEYHPMDPDMLLSTLWDTHKSTAHHLLDVLEELLSISSSLSQEINISAITPPTITHLKKYRSMSHGFLRSVSRNYQHTRNAIRPLYRRNPPGDPSVLSDHIQQLSRYLALKREVKRSHDIASKLFGPYWKADITRSLAKEDIQQLKHLYRWIILFRDQVNEGKISQKSIDLLRKGPNRVKLNGSIHAVSDSALDFHHSMTSLMTRLETNSNILFGKELDHVRITKLRAKLQRWKESPTTTLQMWTQYILNRDDILSTFAAPVIGYAEQDRINPPDLLPCVMGNCADALIKEAFRQRPILSSFISQLHERKIHDFQELDRDLIKLNRQRLVRKLYMRKPMLSDSASIPPSPEMTFLDPTNPSLVFLRSEFNRKRGHRPIRVLMSHAGSLVQKIKPCFMMSPLSISQFLDPRSIQFDVVIFDEASQVRPEDALGALLRGTQVVVMGDTRQLPPTTFFEHMVEDEEMDREDEPDISPAAPLSDMESLLHLCKCNFPTKYLKWHYRSRHESLIAVSNHQFYDDRMFIFPSSHSRSDHLGLKFIHLPDTVYDRGGTARNKDEAAAVAKAALEHYRTYPNKSLGIATFSIKQKNAILEEIERQLSHHPELEEHFGRNNNEYFFVKHLETIQGDERDVIFISVGYGYDMKRKLTMNFGPLNHEGGERRLNVLITRAREKCIVFSNFRGGDMRVNSDTPFGVRSLKAYLDFAEKGKLPSHEMHTHHQFNPSATPIMNSIQQQFAEVGYTMDTMVGCAGFRMELGLKDPRDPSRYALGIQTDGPDYITSPVARDRDRLKRTVLERLGWKIVRVWSTDWYRDYGTVVEGLQNTIDTLVRGTGRIGKPPGILSRNDPGTRFPTSAEESSMNRHRAEMSRGAKNNVFQEVQREQRTELDDRTMIAGIPIPEYEKCTYLNIPIYGEIHERPAAELAQAVSHVVQTEGPVHLNEVIGRIRTLWGLGHTGQRIRKTLTQAIDKAERMRLIYRKGEFLYNTDYYSQDWNIPVRKRGREIKPVIDLISDDEIAEALKLVLSQHGAMSERELFARTYRLFGFNNLGTRIKNRFNMILQRLDNFEEIDRLPDGTVRTYNGK